MAWIRGWIEARAEHARADGVKVQREPGAFEPRVSGDEDGAPGQRLDHEVRSHGGWPTLQYASSCSQSRYVSMQCQKPVCSKTRSSSSTTQRSSGPRSSAQDS